MNLSFLSMILTARLRLPALGLAPCGHSVSMGRTEAAMRPILFLLLAGSFTAANSASLLDIAPFARPCCAMEDRMAPTMFDYRHPRGPALAAGGRTIYGLQWAEERDLFTVTAAFRAPYDARATNTR